ncbi:MAG: L,D-transpeptidase family protein [Brumimicrobium sp.]|nr:L,D-transpeptidase family protein [Brumimicrobium sp.]
MRRFLFFPVIAITLAFTLNSDFLSDQKRYKRVRVAIDEKESLVHEKLNSVGLTTADFQLLMVAYKQEGKLDLYVKKISEKSYRKLKTYDICAKSGTLGPKRKQGDMQVPEGFYHIDRFNPVSNFYLSLGINYPNLSDRRKSKASNLGGDIFIHGSCVTIGCLPMTTDKIKEIYLYAVHAKNNGQDKIPVYIFPFEMTEKKYAQYAEEESSNTELLHFWKNLKAGSDIFYENTQELKFTVDQKGNYVFN